MNPDGVFLSNGPGDPEPCDYAIAAIRTFLDQRLPSAGNGAAEVRNWLAAHGAAGEQGFDLIHYSPMPEIYVGGGFASWRV